MFRFGPSEEKIESTDAWIVLGDILTESVNQSLIDQRRIIAKECDCKYSS
jgi:hypothetical protein